MNKEKIAKIKAKLKQHAPEIAIFTAAIAGTAYLVTSVAKQLSAVEHNVIFEPLPTIEGDERKALMEDENFSLYKLTDDEYMFCRDQLPS